MMAAARICSSSWRPGSRDEIADLKKELRAWTLRASNRPTVGLTVNRGEALHRYP